MSTANCTNPAQDTKKITGTLTLGWSGPFSGPISPFADAVIQGAKDRFALQNQSGGIGGVKLAIATKDDQFNPAMTKSNVDGWIQSGSVQAVTEFGSGPLAAVAADQNLACLPNLFVNATDDTYRDISKYPWTTEFLPSNTVEEAAEVKVIQAEFPGASKITVAVAEDSTGSGQSYLDGLQAAVKGTNVTIKKVVSFGTDPNAAAISLQQAKADVVFGALVVPECLQLTEAMAKIGYSPKLTVQASNCGSASLMFAPAGTAANGQKLVFWEKDPGNPVYAKDPGYQAYARQRDQDRPGARPAQRHVLRDRLDDRRHDGQRVPDCGRVQPRADRGGHHAGVAQPGLPAPAVHRRDQVDHERERGLRHHEAPAAGVQRQQQELQLRRLGHRHLRRHPRRRRLRRRPVAGGR